MNSNNTQTAIEALDEWGKNMPQFPMPCEIELAKHIEIILNVLQNKLVDVEGLKKDWYYYHWGKPKNSEEAKKMKPLPLLPNGERWERDRCIGWNDCIDHLHDNGYLNILSKPIMKKMGK